MNEEQADFLVKSFKENKPRDEHRMRFLCEQRACTIADDIQNDHPDSNIDTSFEVYVFDGDRNGPVGFIYMGDCGEWTFSFDANGDLTERDDLHEWAKQLSPYKSW